MHDMNSIIFELKRMLNKDYLHTSSMYKTNPNLMWIDDDVSDILIENENGCTDILKNMFPEEE